MKITVKRETLHQLARERTGNVERGRSTVLDQDVADLARRLAKATATPGSVQIDITE